MNTNGAGPGSFWKAIVSAETALIIGLFGMWVTAMRERGITKADMESYVRDYVVARGLERNQAQDERIKTLEAEFKELTKK